MSELFIAKVRKVGSSLGILIPKELADLIKIKEGEEVEIGILKKRKIEQIEKMFGIAEGAKSFKREKTDLDIY